MLGWLHAMTWLAGLGAVDIWRRFEGQATRVFCVLLLATGVGQLGWQAWRASFQLHTHRVNPYVYAHPSALVRQIAERVESLSAKHPDGANMAVAYIDDRNVWPLPFYLRGMNRVGFLTAPPENLDPTRAPVVIVKPEWGAGYEALGYARPQNFGVRPGVVVTMYVQQDLWDAWMASR
jgi:hypothetical protein